MIKTFRVMIPVVGAVSLAGHVIAAHRMRMMQTRLVEAQDRAATDPLTGLANRAGLHRAVDELTRVEASYDLVLVDLDKFKPINDTYGHAAGDAVLVQVADRLAEIAADVDGSVAARLGGDEFVIVCPSPAPLAGLLGADVIQCLGAPIDVDGVSVTVTASVGAVHAGAGEPLRTALAAADAAVYEVKACGGDGLVEHTDLDTAPTSEIRPLLRMRELANLVDRLALNGSDPLPPVGRAA